MISMIYRISQPSTVCQGDGKLPSCPLVVRDRMDTFSPSATTLPACRKSKLFLRAEAGKGEDLVETLTIQYMESIWNPLNRDR